MALSSVVSSADSNGREQVCHGTAVFPAACYLNDMSQTVVPWHWHDEIEVGVVLEGSVFFSSGKKCCMLNPGDGLFINAGVLHRCWDEDASCRFLTIVFHPRLVGGGVDSIIYQKYIQPLLEIPDLEWIPLRSDIPRHSEMMTQITDAWHCCVEEPLGYEMKVRNFLSEVILALLQNLPSDRRLPSAKDVRDAQRIKCMLQFIHTNCAEDFRLSQVAESAAISESECIRCFRATIGVTPIQYVRHYRIHRAAQLLLKTDEQVALIGDRCGFRDVSYFTKTFREIMGCAPAEYRKKHLSR